MENKKIVVLGLGYVGLPLAMEFGKIRQVLGFDINANRVAELKKHIDSTLEVLPEDFIESNQISFSSDKTDLSGYDIYIITVPTPVDSAKTPDLSALKSVCKMVGEVMSKGAIVIFESTVYPGCTREVCVPILEEKSGLVFNQDFFVGYSPERANPGDREHRLTTIMKVTSGSTPEIATEIDDLYSEIVPAGTHKTSTIEIAEAAKVIENTQRDLNIALVNELSMIFNKLDIDTLEVLEAAGTKWNFLPFRPGLVGGHCIGVDPYYLTHRAKSIGYNPEIILSGRRVNDGMAYYVADQVCHLMMKSEIPVINSNILIMGVSFKENCPDIRNSKVIDLVQRLVEANACVDIYDPWVDTKQVQRELNVSCMDSLPTTKKYDAIVLTVGHKEFLKMGADSIRDLGKEDCIIYDVKSVLPKTSSQGRL